ncbi:putative c6 zinc finger domain-containing protein [Botrytis fragariae]|uniref:Putative c6 zinc finger domain-containing protein n=1 Tax=Botrytis fragariae TaxID=1964551 RepID=A0A8H6EFV1_9HELO|nr:putative c6 zinc finger domain-containing protein [Botrytis fragariae]KAF5870631.1 putative c6 zinc finger domain-containing protein [Botrytis fragariae]
MSDLEPELEAEPEQERRRRRPAVIAVLAPSVGDAKSNAIECFHVAIVPSRAQHDENRRNSSHKQNYDMSNEPASERERGLTLGVPTYPAPPTSNNLIPLSPTNQFIAPVSDATSDLESMRQRIKELEDQLSLATKSSVPSPALSQPAPSPVTSVVSNIETKTSLAGSFHIHKECRPFGQDHPAVVAYGVLHKTRLLGQSHWINAVTGYHDLFEIIEPHIQEGTKAAIGLHKCKTFGKLVKTRRAPLWPSPPTWPDLPSKETADILVDCYLRTIESIYRVLHIPTFKNNYEAIWTSTGKPDTEFLVQLKLIFAIGSATFDDQFSLRASAVRWVYEAQTWISEPEFKSRLTIKSLQTEILLLFAREITNIGGRLIWISAGSLFRSAVHMGLHKDPTYLPKKTIFAAEMRRRLWNTILELMLQSSMDSGGPPLMSLTDWDTEPPANFNDDELLSTDALPRPENEFSQTSLAIILRKTFPLRLAIAKSLNDCSTINTFEEAMKLDTELRSSYKALCQDVQEFNTTNESLLPQFEIEMLNIIMLRYLSSLHIPFFVSALQSLTYTSSRKVVLETSLKIWYMIHSTKLNNEAQPHEKLVEDSQQYLSRLAICGSGLLRTMATQAGFIIAMEIKTQLQEETSLGPISLRPDLLDALQDVKTWNMRCIEAGEVNMKGYLFICLAIAHIDALQQSQVGEELAASIVSAAEKAVDECAEVLEKMATHGLNETESLSKMSLTTPTELMGDWDFMMTDAQYNFGDAMGWAFNYDHPQDISIW